MSAYEPISVLLFPQPQPAAPRAIHLCDASASAGARPNTALASTPEASRGKGACRALGTIDTDTTRGYDFPKVPPEFAAARIFDGREKEEEDIFPDPTSQTLADGWRAGVAIALERRINAIELQGAQIDPRERL